jgi:DNA-binding CsgD family transcriptional regulator
VTDWSTLTARELEVAALVAEGRTNKEIAARLFLSERTAEGHLEHIRDKLGFSTRSQIATWYTQTRGAPVANLPATPPAPRAPAPASTTSPAPTARRAGQLRGPVLIGALLLVAVVVVAAMIVSRPGVPTLVLVAGLGTDGYSGDGGPATVAQLSELTSMFFDADGLLVIADSQTGLNRVGQFIDRTHIRRVARDGTITTVSGDGMLDAMTSASAAALSLNGGAHAAPGPNGAIFVAFGYESTGPGRLGRIDADGTFHLLATRDGAGYGAGGGPATLAQLVEPGGLAVDHVGTVFLLDNSSSVVRTILRNGTIAVVAGTGERGNTGDGGPATAATLFAPLAIALSADGSLFIADTNNNRVRRIDHGGAMQPVVDGLSLPSSLAFGPGDLLYVADTGNARVLRITPQGLVTTVAGPSGLVRPTALAVDASGTLFIGDSGLHRIFRLANG